MNLSAVILAGGESRRMGRDKAWLELDGEPLIARAIRLVRSVGITEVLVSGRAGTDYSRLGCPVLFDLEPGRGPLGGIERALDVAPSPLLLVLAVDLPRMTVDFLRRLAEACTWNCGAVPWRRGQLEPLVATYPRECHELAVRCLREHRLAARDFAQACLESGWVSRFPVPAEDACLFANWNHPHEFSAPMSDGRLGLIAAQSASCQTASPSPD